jgi:hypothetical protein
MPVRHRQHTPPSFYPFPPSRPSHVPRYRWSRNHMPPTPWCSCLPLSRNLVPPPRRRCPPVTPSHRRHASPHPQGASWAERAATAVAQCPGATPPLQLPLPPHPARQRLHPVTAAPSKRRSTWRRNTPAAGRREQRRRRDALDFGAAPTVGSLHPPPSLAVKLSSLDYSPSNWLILILNSRCMCWSTFQHSVPIYGALIPIYGVIVLQFNSGSPRRWWRQPTVLPPPQATTTSTSPMSRLPQHSKGTNKMPSCSYLCDIRFAYYKRSSFLGWIRICVADVGAFCVDLWCWGWIRICVADVEDGLRLIKVRFKADSGAMERLKNVL